MTKNTRFSPEVRQRAVILTSNKGFADWGEMFGDNVLATAILDRLLHHSTTLNIIGVSLDIENYCTLRLFFDLSTLAGLSRRNLPEAGILLLFQM